MVMRLFHQSVSLSLRGISNWRSRAERRQYLMAAYLSLLAGDADNVEGGVNEQPGALLGGNHCGAENSGNASLVRDRQGANQDNGGFAIITAQIGQIASLLDTRHHGFTGWRNRLEARHCLVAASLMLLLGEGREGGDGEDGGEILALLGTNQEGDEDENGEGLNLDQQIAQIAGEDAAGEDANVSFAQASVANTPPSWEVALDDLQALHAQHLSEYLRDWDSEACLPVSVASIDHQGEPWDGTFSYQEEHHDWATAAIGGRPARSQPNGSQVGEVRAGILPHDVRKSLFSNLHREHGTAENESFLHVAAIMALVSAKGMGASRLWGDPDTSRATMQSFPAWGERPRDQEEPFTRWGEQWGEQNVTYIDSEGDEDSQYATVLTGADPNDEAQSEDRNQQRETHQAGSPPEKQSTQTVNVHMDPGAGPPVSQDLNGSEGKDVLEGDQFDNRINGYDGDDHLVGQGGNDLLIGGLGNDFLDGGDGDDFLDGGDGGDSLDGGDGDDFLDGGSGADVLIGSNGIDTASYTPLANTTISSFQQDPGVGVQDPGVGVQDPGVGVFVNLETGSGAGGDAEGDILIDIENLIGTNSRDNLIGDDNDNVLAGRGGDDSIIGGHGDDTLIGNAGRDTFMDDSGANVYVYSLQSDSYGGEVQYGDAIYFFGDHQKIDLSAVDADTSTTGHQKFSYIGNAAFKDGVAGQIRYYQIAGERQDLVIEIDTDLDSDAEMSILLVDCGELRAESFILE